MATSSPLAAQNKAALEYLVQAPVTREMVSYLAQKAAEVIRCDQSPIPAAGDLLTPPTTPPRDLSDPTLPPLEAFITSIVQQSHVQVPTLMPALVYLARLKAKLPPVAQGIPSTVHRIFLAALILAAKNLNDSSPKNKHWARYTSVPGYPSFAFTNSEVNLMEKQLLYLLDWDLQIQNDDLYFHLEPFLAPVRVKLAQRAERKMQVLLREREQAHYRQQAEYRAHQQSMSSLACNSQVNLSHIVAQARPQHFQPRQQMLYDSPASTTYSLASRTDSPHSYSRSRSVSLNPPSLTHSRSSSAGPARTPSLSPPSRCESSASSACDTPASYASSASSLPYPTKPQEAKIAMPAHPTEYGDGYGQGYQYIHHDMPEIIHIQPVSKVAPMSVPTVPSQPQKALPLPAGKRLRSAGTNLISRLIGTGAPVPGPGQSRPTVPLQTT